MSQEDRVLKNVQDYSQKIKDKEYASPSWASKKAQEARVEKTIKELQNLVKAQQEAIEQVRMSFDCQDHALIACLQIKSVRDTPPIQTPATDLAERLHQLRIIKSGYERLAAKDPFLPTSDTALPSLLALRYVGKVVSEDKAHLSVKQKELAEAREQLAKQESRVRENKRFSEALGSRIEELRIKHSEKSQRTPEEEAQSLLEEERKRRLDYIRDRKALTRTLVNFINDPLAAMLAAEDLGGPVVGDQLDISDEMLQAGFSQLGKPKKFKPSTSAEDDGKRQRRIKQICGSGDDDEEQDLPGTEREAAAQQMRGLVEELLNAAAENDVEESYVDIKKDSAAVRFLVRANVAEFHPEDARKLRLIDFVSEYDDEDENEDEDDDAEDGGK